MQQNFSVITAKTVENIINNNHEKVYNIIKEAYMAHHNKETINPPSYFLWYPEKSLSRIIALPALLSNQKKSVGIKWISSNPDNINIGLNRASAVVILNDYETGCPIACVEGSLISATRTAYSAVLISEYLLKNKEIETIGIIGTGKISFNIIKCLSKQNWRAKNIVLYDKVKSYAQDFVTQLASHNIDLSSKIKIAEDLDTLVKQSDLLIFTTTGKIPYLDNYELLKKRAVLLNISLRDISPDIIVKTDNIVDDLEHVMNANTSPHLAQQKFKHTKFITNTVGEILSGQNDCNNKPIVFSPMGLGILDIALTQFIYELAQKEQKDISIKNFF